MWPAVEELLGNGDFRLQPGQTNNGLTVLERV